MMTINRVRQHWDVIIVGAGIAGCATAIALLQQLPNLSVLLLERRDITPQAFRIGETLPPQAAVLLQQLGLLEQFRLRGDLASMGNRSVWGSPSIDENPFLYSCYGHGWHIDRASFDSWMAQQTQCAGAMMLYNTTVTGAPEYDQGWYLSISQNGIETLTLETSVVIDASGSGAAFCRNQNVHIKTLDKLIGIFRYFQGNNAITGDMENGSDSYTLVESCSYGWWYSAELPHGRWVAALMTDSDLARRSNLLNEAVWQNTLLSMHHTYKRLAPAKPLTSLFVKPAHSKKLERFSGPGWYAAGDAAFTFDPLSSLGIYKALRHGLLASYAIKDDLQNKSEAKEKYQYVLHSEFEQYQQTHQQYYQLEKRFENTPFWQRRHQQMLQPVMSS